jgi:GATA-binding protein
MNKTERLMFMVDSKLAIAGPSPTAPTSIPVRSGSHKGTHAEDWEFEERDRARAKQIQNLEDERVSDRIEREKRQRERDENILATERARALHRPGEQRNLGFGGGFFGTIGADKGREREWEQMRERQAREREAKEREASVRVGDRARSEAERNRDLLLASRRVAAVTPIPSNGLRPGPTGQRSTSNSPSISVRSVHSVGPTSITSAQSVSGWDGEPVMAGSTLSLRNQHPGLHPASSIPIHRSSSVASSVGGPANVSKATPNTSDPATPAGSAGAKSPVVATALSSSLESSAGNKRVNGQAGADVMGESKQAEQINHARGMGTGLWSGI